MIKLASTKQPSIVVYNVSQSDPETGRRFIVPVTNPEADLTSITQRVWELANATGARILFLGLCNDAMQELSLRRALATTSAMVNDGHVSAEFEILFGRNWVEEVKSRVQTGDTVVCWHENHAGLLRAELVVPVYFITTNHHKERQRSNWYTRAAAWIGSIAIIVFFFFIQVQINQFAKNWVTVMQLLSVAGEFWLIWSWNNLLR